MDKVIIFDTTLRDGEQAAGGALTAEDKMEIARQLDQLGVDVIEAGFSISSRGELDAVRRIADELHQLKKDRQQILETSRGMVARAKGYLEDVEFSPRNATRTDPEYIYRILEGVIEAGATTVNIPDTVGYTIPREFCNLIDGIFKNMPNIHRAPGGDRYGYQYLPGSVKIHYGDRHHANLQDQLPGERSDRDVCPAEQGHCRSQCLPP